MTKLTIDGDGFSCEFDLTSKFAFEMAMLVIHELQEKSHQPIKVTPPDGVSEAVRKQLETIYPSGLT